MTQNAEPSLARLEAEKEFHDRKYAKEKTDNYYSQGFMSIVFEDSNDQDLGPGRQKSTRVRLR